jgi:Cd2+/Zn2+-exporting ATPase
MLMTRNVEMKRTYVLEGLCCPNCAAKISEMVREVRGVKQASLKYPDTRLFVEFEGDEASLLKVIAYIVRNVDADIVVKAT